MNFSMISARFVPLEASNIQSYRSSRVCPVFSWGGTLLYALIAVNAPIMGMVYISFNNSFFHENLPFHLFICSIYQNIFEMFLWHMLNACKKSASLRGYYNPYLNWAYFVCYLKSINTFFKKIINASSSKFSMELK